MHRPHPWLGLRKWQRHSTILLVAGLIYVGIGLGMVYLEPSPSRFHALVAALKWAPMSFWGQVFIFAGFLSMISARWPPASKVWGYMVLTGLSAGWSAFYAVGIFMGANLTSNLAGAATWGLIAFLWWAITGLRNKDDVVIPHGLQ